MHGKNMKNAVHDGDNTDETLSTKGERPYLTRHQLELELSLSKGRYYNDPTYSIHDTDEPSSMKNRSWITNLIEMGQVLRLWTNEKIVYLFKHHRRFLDDDNVPVNHLSHQSNIMDTKEGLTPVAVNRENILSSHMTENSIEEKSLGGKTYHSILWEELSIDREPNDDGMNSLLDTNHPTQKGQKSKCNLSPWKCTKKLDLSTMRGRIVMEFVAICQLAYAIISYQV
jgi:hypothetical protein